MIHGIKVMEDDYTVITVDGEIGPVREFYFDDFHWVVRYLAVDVEGGSILLSPIAFDSLDTEAKVIYLKGDLDFILNSPRFDLSRPVNRVQEEELHNYFDWPFYWLAPGLISYPLIELTSEMREQGNPALQEDPEKQHLRSTSSVLGDRIEARDGHIGRVSDFLVDDESWRIQYVLIDTGGLLRRHKVLIAPQWVQVDWGGDVVRVDLSRETIHNSPEWDPSVPLDEDYDRKLEEHYRGE